MTFTVEITISRQPKETDSETLAILVNLFVFVVLMLLVDDFFDIQHNFDPFLLFVACIDIGRSSNWKTQPPRQLPCTPGHG